MVTTLDVQPGKSWSEALFGFKLDLQSQHRSDGTIRNQLCSAIIMARHATAAGLDSPSDVSYAWLAQYMSVQYAGPQAERPVLAVRRSQRVLELVQHRLQG